MDTVPYKFCKLVTDCIPFSMIPNSYEIISINGRKWRKACRESKRNRKLHFQLLYCTTGTWEYSIHDQDNNALTIQELTQKPNFKDYRIEHLEIYTDNRNVYNLHDLHPLDRSLNAFLNVLSFLSNEVRLTIDTHTPLKPEDESTIVERLEQLRFYDLSIDTFTAAYHNLLRLHLDVIDNDLQSPNHLLCLSSEEWPEESLAMVLNSIRSAKLRQVYIENNPPWSFAIFELIFKMVEADADSFLDDGLDIRAQFTKSSRMKRKLKNFREEISKHKRNSKDEVLTWRWYLPTTEEHDLVFTVKLDDDCTYTISTDYDEQYDNKTDESGEEDDSDEDSDEDDRYVDSDSDE